MQITKSKLHEIFDCETHRCLVSVGSGASDQGEPLVVLTRTRGFNSLITSVPLEAEWTFFTEEDRDAYYDKLDEAAAREFIERGLAGLDEVMNRG